MKLDVELKDPQAPTVLVVFGATGDLMTKKIAPSLYQLFCDGRLPTLFSIIGSSRREWLDQDFRNHIKHILEKSNQPLHKLDDFLEHVLFQKAEFSNAQDYQNMAKRLKNIDADWKSHTNKLFYLAVPPSSYEMLFQQLATSGLTKEPTEGSWTRVIVEKPFGDDFQSAQELDMKLGKLFKEEQIYRIDHYLGKEMLQNILVFRFVNNLFEKMWNNEGIESVEIVLDEALGIEQRGDFYDKVGALKDVGQNHMLQMISLMIMDNPLEFSSEKVRQKRSEAMKSLPIMSDDDVKQYTRRFQHQGYKDIDGVEQDSMIETYFYIQFLLQGERWSGVPITIRGGKKTGHTQKEIIVTFRHPQPCLCSDDSHHIKNRVKISFDTADEIRVSVWSKKAGQGFEVEENELLVEYDEGNNRQYTSEYERLVLDCIRGNQMMFVSTQEVAAMWKVIDPIVEAWQKNIVPLETYKPDTQPPIEEKA